MPLPICRGRARPTIAPLTRDLLASEGGPFAIGTLVELGEVTPHPEAPETEDHLFNGICMAD
jgi:hypothetical protein